VTRTRSWIASILALVLIVSMPVAASAHSSVVGSTPEAGATLDAAPSSVSVDFDSPLMDIGAAIVVRSAAGVAITTAAPVVDDMSLSVAVDPAAPAGEYTVGFRVVSKDGHTIESSFTYVVAGPAASSQASRPVSERPAISAPASPVPASTSAATSASTATAAADAPTPDEGTAWLPALVIAAAIVALIVAVAGAIALRR
jgi:methionine-rich copper-binding protein CopC